MPTTPQQQQQPNSHRSHVMEGVSAAENDEVPDIYGNLLPSATLVLLKESHNRPSALARARKQPEHLKKAVAWARQPASNSNADCAKLLFHGDKEALKKRLCEWVGDRKEYLEKDTQWKAESLFVTEKMLQKLKRARPLGPKFCRIWSEMMQAGTSNAVIEDKKLAGFELELVAAWLFASSLRGTGATYSGWLERTVEFAQDVAMFPESIDKAREQNLEAELLVTHALREVTGNQYSLINITTRDQLNHVTNMARYRKMVIEKFSNSVDKRFEAIWRKAEKAQLKKDKAQWKKNKAKAQGNPVDPGADTNEKGEEEDRPGEAEAAYQAQLSADSQRALEGLARLGLA